MRVTENIRDRGVVMWQGFMETLCTQKTVLFSHYGFPHPMFYWEGIMHEKMDVKILTDWTTNGMVPNYVRLQSTIFRKMCSPLRPLRSNAKLIDVRTFSIYLCVFSPRCVDLSGAYVPLWLHVSLSVPRPDWAGGPWTLQSLLHFLEGDRSWGTRCQPALWSHRPSR